MSMGSKIIMGVLFIHILLSLLSYTYNGDWIGTGDNSAIDAVTKYTTKGISWYQFPIVFGEFFIVGVPAMITWDYSIFDNTWGSFVRWTFGACLSIAFVWAILQIMLPIIGGIISNIIGGLTSVFGRVFR